MLDKLTQAFGMKGSRLLAKGILLVGAISIFSPHPQFITDFLMWKFLDMDLLTGGNILATLMVLLFFMMQKNYI